MDHNDDDPLLDTLDTVREKADGDTVRLGAVLAGVGERGYGPLIALVSAFCILPTGGIPGVPAVIGVIIILLGLQMLIGRDRPWFPDAIKSFCINSETLKSSVDKARPWAERLEVLIRHRLSPLTNGPVANRAIAACIICSGLLMIPLGFIPFVPALLGFATLLLGIGVTARDGVIVSLGYLIFASGAYTAWNYAPTG